MARPVPFHVPNVRKIFIPDQGKLIFDMDLIGADATVAAKECGGAYWKAIQDGRKINVEILEHCWPDTYKKWIAGGKKDVDREPQYTKGKNIHYGTLYVGGPSGIGAAASIPAGIVQTGQSYIFQQFPEIKGWHDRTEYELQTERTIYNAFGHRVVYFDRVEGLLPEAVNWKCQSTVALVCQGCSLIIRREFPEVDLLDQVHDSLVGQIAYRHVESVLPRLLARVNTFPVPYTKPYPLKRGQSGTSDPLFIPWSMKASRRSWGECGIDYDLDAILKKAA